MPRILALSGSLRRGSLNTRLAHALAARAPAGSEVEVITPAGIPLYDGDLEKSQGIPDTVEEMKARITTSDGLVLVTPEYNQGVPGVMKNVIDWLSRPPADIERVFGGLAVAICGATPGRAGTRSAQHALLPTLRALGTQVWSGKTLYISGASKVLEEDGSVTDDELDKRMSSFVAGFSHFASGR